MLKMLLVECSIKNFFVVGLGVTIAGFLLRIKKLIGNDLTLLYKNVILY